MIPKGWTEYPLSALIASSDTGVSVHAESRVKSKEEVGVLKTSAVSYGIFNPNEHKAVLKSEESRLATCLQKDTIIICRSNTSALVGSSAYVDRDYNDLFLPDTLWQLTRKSECISMRWLSYLLNSDKMRKQLLNIAAGTSGSMKKISKRNFLRIRVEIPSLPEQEKIAAILETRDRATALTERRLAAAEQRKKALMQKVLTGQVRFPEFVGEEWREVRLGEILKERKERGYEDLPLLSVTADQGIIYRDELDRRDSSSEDKSKYLRVCEGDIAYNTMRMWQGRSGVSELEGIVSPAYTVCTPKPTTDVHFMGHLFQLSSIIYLFYRYSQGLVSDTWNLKFDQFAKIKVKLPSLAEQKKIASVLDACDREIDLLRHKRDALQQQKKGLMQRLLTGRVRVKI